MLSVIIPTHNEEKSICEVIDSLHQALVHYGWQYELIVVDDGSTDKTAEKVAEEEVILVSHGTAHGYGQALRSGISVAKYNLIAIIDGDGSYLATDLVRMIPYLEKYDMIVGARTGTEYQGSKLKWLGRSCLIYFCEFVSGTKIRDINSGLRIFRKSHIMRFLNQLSYGFSFTTSLTTCLLLNGYFVGYLDISYLKRSGNSKVRHFRDSLRTLQIVFEAFARYNPFKLFLSLIVCIVLIILFSLLCVLIGLGNGIFWLIVDLLVMTISILAGLSFVAVQLVNRSEKVYAPKYSLTSSDEKDKINR